VSHKQTSFEHCVAVIVLQGSKFSQNQTVSLGRLRLVNEKLLISQEVPLAFIPQ
jgi:hypothetical protein